MRLRKPSQVCSGLSASALMKRGLGPVVFVRSRTQFFYVSAEKSTSMGLPPVRAVVCQGSSGRPVPSGAQDVTGRCERSTAISLTGRADRGVEARVNTPKERRCSWRQVRYLGR